MTLSTLSDTYRQFNVWIGLKAITINHNYPFSGSFYHQSSPSVAHPHLKPMTSPRHLRLSLLMTLLAMMPNTVTSMMEEKIEVPPDVVELVETATNQPAPPTPPKQPESKAGPILIKVN